MITRLKPLSHDGSLPTSRVAPPSAIVVAINQPPELKASRFGLAA
jgi:hypothetical protein